MNECEYQIAKLKALLETYIQLMRLRAEPGDKVYALNQGIDFIRKQIRDALK